MGLVAILPLNIWDMKKEMQSIQWMAQAGHITHEQAQKVAEIRARVKEPLAVPSRKSA